MTYEQAAIERRTSTSLKQTCFQSDSQIRMLQIHTRLCAIANVVYGPVRKVLESFGYTQVFHMNERPKLRVVK
jgi:hypothetical protein